MRRLKILTWHIHGNYLYYLTQARHDFYLPVKPGGPPRFSGRGGTFPWGDNVHEVPVEELPGLDLDLILFQARENYAEDQYELSPQQRQLPRIYLEHDPPRENPTDTRHLVDDPNILLVHCTHFNRLMWDSNRTPTRVIEHGVLVPDHIRYTGELERGMVVVNNILKRGRRLGLDVFESVRRQVSLDLIGLNSQEVGGLGPLAHDAVWPFEARYRFFFNPIRYTSLGLAVCEAMMIGMPIIGLATTEMVSTVENGVSGYLDTNVDNLVDCMRELFADPIEARYLGQGARHMAEERFNIRRFIRDWDEAFALVTGVKKEEGRKVKLGPEQDRLAARNLPPSVR